MAGWLIKTRIRMCVKSLKLNLENNDGLDRAKTLAMSQLLWIKFLEEVPGLNLAFEHTDRFSHDQLLEVYKALEEARYMAEVGLRQQKKIFKNWEAGWGILPPSQITIPPPPKNIVRDLENHVKLTIRALDVWMVSVSRGIMPSTTKDVIYIWNMLEGSKEHL